MRFLPPGGFAGFNQQTNAAKVMHLRTGGGRTGVKRRKKRKSAKRAKSATRKRAKSSGRKMKFGSPAWQKKYKVGAYRK